MHVAGTLNTMADFLSRLEITPKEKIELTIREDIRTTPIQINMQLTDVADDEQQFFVPDEQFETEEEILQRKIIAKQQAPTAKQNEITATKQEATMIPINKLSYSLGAINENSRITNEQDADTVLKAIKAKLLQEEYDAHLLQTDPKAQKLLKHENRITFKDGMLVRKYYGECGQVIHNLVILPTHIIPELLRTLHGTSGKHPGITKMIQQCRTKYYYPDSASHIKQWITNCQDCIKYKRINARLTRPKIIDPKEFSLEPEDILGIDILPNLPNSAGYQHIVTMIDVFSRYLFAYPVQNISAHTVGRCIIDVMTRHSYLPTRIISDK